MRRTTGRRSGARNMCSVRQSPIPSAPNSRATLESSPVSALARTASLPLRISSAHLRIVWNSAGGFDPAIASAPSMISPVAPSMEMVSPSRTTVSPTANCLPSILTASAPTTAGVPQPRATTAAWLTRPPRAVRMPLATIMPCTSSGLVSLRTRMTASPALAARSASSAVKYTLPTAAPGDAARPLATALVLLANCGCKTESRWSAVMRMSASFLLIFHLYLPVPPFLAISTAMRRAAAPVRLPTRVCSIQSLPSSMVNSVSHMSL